MDENIERTAFAIALADHLVTPLGRRELTWPDSWCEEEAESYRAQARAALACASGTDPRLAAQQVYGEAS